MNLTTGLTTPDVGSAYATPGAPKVPVKALEQKHPEHDLQLVMWQNLDILRKGGRILQGNADRFLVKRPKEPNDLYLTRLQHFRYQNILSACLGYYGSKLFEEDAQVDIKENGTAIEAPADGQEPDETWGFYHDTFIKDCDRAGTTFTDFMRTVAEDIIVFNGSYVLIDLPKSETQATTLAEQDIRPLLRRYDPRNAINWDKDQYGNLEWIVFEISTIEHTFLQGARLVRKWYYFDRTQYMVYEWHESSDPKDSSDPQYATLIDGPSPHSMADYKNPETGQLGRVPVLHFEVPYEMWLGNRVYFTLIDHLNLENTFSWGLTLANLPMPVIISEISDYDLKVSEGGFVLLPKGSEFHWSEPNGTSFETSDKRLASLREEAYRMMHLQAQGRSSAATPASQSGYSKEQDMAPANDILNFFGDHIRAAQQLILECVGAIRADEKVTFDVRGYDFTEPETLIDIEEASAVEGLNIPSELFRKERYKDVVRKYAHDWNPDTVAAICEEIDKAPTQEELDAKAQESELNLIQQGVQRAAAKTLTGH